MKLFPSNVYVNRRTRLMQKISSGILLLPGNNYSPMNYPANSYRFRQDSTFLYLIGLQLPGLAAIIDIDLQTCTLYGDDVDIDDIIWMGYQPKLQELAERVGIKTVKPLRSLHDDVTNALLSQRKVHYIPPYRHDTMILLNQLLKIPFQELKNQASAEAIRALVSLREIKETFEIEQMKIAAQIGFNMHMEALKLIKPDLYESDIAGTVEGIALSADGNVSFQVICTTHGEILHNHNHSNKLINGKLLLLDAGAENQMHYCSDFTRVFPVSGKFTEQQKNIYNIVLEANNKAFQMLRPSIPFRDVHIKACQIIALRLNELGLMKGNPDEAVANGAHALFFPHGLGHMIGLDVHDMENYGENFVGYGDVIERSTQFGLAYLRFAKPLKSGFCLTIEPGIYFIPPLIEKWKAERKFEHFINYNEIEKYLDFGGIRLEDNVLITENRAEYIGERIPIDPNDIERLKN